MTKFVAGLGKLAKVKVLGEVKKFKRAPEINMMPHYYVLIEDIEAIDAAPAKPAEGEKPEKPGRRPRGPRWGK